MKWLAMAGVLASSVIVYMACVGIKETRTNPVIHKDLVKWERTGDSAATTFLQKDSLGNITMLETNLERNQFTFCNDSLVLTEFSKEENRMVYYFKGKLDSISRLTGGVAITSYAATSPDTVVHTFEYNEAGYLAKEFRDYGKNGVYTILYEYEKGDAVKIYTYYNDELYNTKEFEYYENRVNLTGLEDFKFRRNINHVTGKTSSHLVKKITSIGRGGKLNYSFDYEYETDEEGLPVKQVTKKGKKVNAVTTYYYARV